MYACPYLRTPVQYSAVIKRQFRKLSTKSMLLETHFRKFSSLLVIHMNAAKLRNFEVEHH